MKSIILDYIRAECIDEHITTEITETTPLISGGFIDSFGLMGLLLFLEREFEVSIPHHRTSRQDFDTVNRMVQVIKELQHSPYVDELDGL